MICHGRCHGYAMAYAMAYAEISVWPPEANPTFRNDIKPGGVIFPKCEPVESHAETVQVQLSNRKQLQFVFQKCQNQIVFVHIWCTVCFLVQVFQEPPAALVHRNPPFVHLAAPSASSIGAQYASSKQGSYWVSCLSRDRKFEYLG